jgi:glycosyltransferase involved in cell wall biosynthesis
MSAIIVSRQDHSRSLHDRQLAFDLDLQYGHLSEFGDFSCRCRTPVTAETLNGELHACGRPLHALPFLHDRGITTILYGYRGADDDVYVRAIAKYKDVILLLHHIPTAPFLKKVVRGAIAFKESQQKIASNVLPNVMHIDHSPQRRYYVTDESNNIGWKRTAKTVYGWHGSWRPDKGVHKLIAAFNEFSKINPDTELVCIGMLDMIAGITKPTSSVLVDHCREIAGNNVTFITSYTPNHQLHMILEQFDHICCSAAHPAALATTRAANRNLIKMEMLNADDCLKGLQTHVRMSGSPTNKDAVVSKFSLLLSQCSLR